MMRYYSNYLSFYSIKISIISIFITAILLCFTSVGNRISDSYYLQINIQSPVNGKAQVFYDCGNGYREIESVVVNIKANNSPCTCRFKLPHGKYRRIRLDPIDTEAVIKFSDAKILYSSGKVLKDIHATEFKPINNIASVEDIGNYRKVIPTKNGVDPYLSVEFYPLLKLKLNNLTVIITVLSLYSLVFIGCAVLLFILRYLYARNYKKIHEKIWWITRCCISHPSLSIVLMAFIATILNSFPVIFLGKSFVSPNCGTILLYDSMPTLPGYHATEVSSPPGSDVGAMMWQHLPYSVIQKRAFFTYGELPFWNRYNSCGVTLLGQGQSMFGDPFQSIIFLTKNLAFAWDIKFLLAKFLFSLGIGLCIYLVLNNLRIAILFVFSALYIGFFAFRFNHPAFFSMCYAPWILYCWLNIVNAFTLKRSAFWAIALILVSWIEITSGTIKEAYMLLIFINIYGLIIFSLSNVKYKIKKTLYLFFAALIFIFISALNWVIFKEALSRAYTAYNAPGAQQIPIGVVIGFFDEIFYRQLNPYEWVYRPAVNFLVFLGFLWSLSDWRFLIKKSYIYTATILSAILPFCLIFGLVPERIIVMIPFLRNIIHINNVFSCVLIIHIIILAAYGFFAMARNCHSREWNRSRMFVISTAICLIVSYFYCSQINHKSSFFYVNLSMLLIAFVIFPIVIKQLILEKNHTFITITIFIICICVFHWRYGLYGNGILNNRLIRPQVRTDLQAPSPAIDYIKEQSVVTPYRAVGFGNVLFPGYSGIYALESISGPDAIQNQFYKELIIAFNIKQDWYWKITVEEESLDRLKPVYDLLNIKYYLRSHHNEQQDLVGLKSKEQLDLDIYTSDTVWPRAFFTDTCSIYSQISDFVDLVNNGNGQPFAAVTDEKVMEKLGLLNIPHNQGIRVIIPAENYILTNNSTTFTIKTPKEGIVVLTETYEDKNFRVSINGNRVDYFRVNHAFKGIKLNRGGTYKITFSYWPQSVTFLLYLFAIGCFMMITWIVYIVFSKNE